ncbi:unnamed protein product [Ambrosiozyma monospora]|uniref:Unnamed protein product n=1 Tax=Ambrosiozyma monospora TaxID=43982 RepID=A0A9W7DDI6_AMBMO|nr:unnamed protein product [Ambrosiozyma monospora]
MAIGHQEERSDLTVGGIKTLTKEITDQVIEQIGEKENTKMKELEVKITTLETDNKELKTQLAEYQTQASSNKTDTAKPLVNTNLMAIDYQELLEKLESMKWSNGKEKQFMELVEARLKAQ